jgi:acetyl-CoA C-acetyltransferase
MSVYIVDALRTPIGNFNGSLSSFNAHELGQVLIQELVDRNQIKGKEISEVILGQVLTGGQGQNPARQAALKAGIPVDVPAITINQVCGSGLRSIAMAFQAIVAGDSSIILAGGQESMSRSQHSVYMRSGIKMGNTELKDMMLSDGLMDAFDSIHMGNTAENIAKKYGISREEQDEFALLSQKKADEAQKLNKFEDEILPIELITKKDKIIINRDEFIKPDTSIESLSKLRPAFAEQGTVTAGNSSGINDGAAVCLIMNEEEIKKRNISPMARIVSWAHVGVEPAIMGTGPIQAVKKALIKAQWNIDDLDLIESNEAFAAQAISANRELGWNTDIVNVNGGSIALGHPIGASGTRILVTLLHEMKKRKAKRGLATLCIGGGMGIALCVESM